MSKDFNSDMFSAILKANESAMSLLEKQLEETKNQAKRKDIIYCIIFIIMCLLMGGSIWAYTQKKVSMNVDYDQNLDDNALTESTVSYDNKVKTE